MKPIFTYTNGMLPVSTHYCPGCTHGIAHRLIMEVLEENGTRFQYIDYVNHSPIRLSP